MNVNKININQQESSYYIASDIYDVSYHNSGTTFESLSTLLNDSNLSTLIPTEVRCGGMTIRFIQSSDNKYVQYRLMSNEFCTDATQWAIDDESVYVENPEFIYVKKDADDRLIWWIYADGSVDWAKGVPTPIQEELKKLEQKIKDNIEGAESIVARVTSNENDIIAINNSLVDLTDVVSKKRDGEYIDNNEFIDVTKDADGRILECTKLDGSHYIHRVESETIPTEFHNINDVEGRIDIKTDADGRIIRYTKKDGITVFESGIESPEIERINKKIENISFNEIQSIKELDAQKYGAEYKGTFSLLTNTNYYITVEDIVTENKGWL